MPDHSVPTLQHVLAATDFSPRAEVAVARAHRLAQKHQARFTLLHVVPRLPGEVFKRLLFNTPLETEQKIIDLARDQLNELAAKLGPAGGDIHCHVAVGRHHVEINAYARSVQADMLVLGAQGERIIEEILLGTTVSKVLRRAGMPVLIARGGAQPDYRRVLVPVDFSETSHAALGYALAVEPEAEIFLIHAFEVPFEGKMFYAGVDESVIIRHRQEALAEAHRQMSAFVARWPEPLRKRFHTDIEHGYPPAVIRRAAESERADLIVMGRRGKEELDEMFLGSVTKHVLYETALDMVIVPPSTAE